MQRAEKAPGRHQVGGERRREGDVAAAAAGVLDRVGRVGELNDDRLGAADRDRTVELFDRQLRLLTLVEPHEADPFRYSCRKESFQSGNRLDRLTTIRLSRYVQYRCRCFVVIAGSSHVIIDLSPRRSAFVVYPRS